MILLRQMHVATTSLLIDSYHHSSKLFQFCSFTVSTYFIYLIEVIVHWISVVVLLISVFWYSICYSFHSAHKSISMYPQQFHLNTKYKKGNTNHVVD
jgi:hypothetical protein